MYILLPQPRLCATHPHDAVALHDRNLNVLRAGLDDLEQRLDGELDGELAVEVLGVVLLQELADGLGRTANGARLPGRVDSRGLGHEQVRHSVVGVKADDEGRDTERAHTTRLGVLLLDARNVLGNVLDGDGVLDSEAVGLALDARLVDQDTAVGGETWTGCQ